MPEEFQSSALPELPESVLESSEVPQGAAEFRTVPSDAENFGSVPQASEQRETHTLTVKETARMFEAAGVARTERSIINWCQPNRQGIKRLDSYYDPNERKYYLTPQSVETVIQEEIQRLNKSTDASAAEGFGSPVAHVKHFAADNLMPADERKIQELEREIMDLKIANRGKDYLIGELNKERNRFFNQLLDANRTVGQLETKLNQLEAPKP